ncbi:CREB/ATF bZIP transcription factor [Notamacropus eugenii]|uniref:CREB/ATF bZIP transcription factor n=1 Tax=Notamacropus eugenii TaxID=9315 RepID=UPI003B66D82B
MRHSLTKLLAASGSGSPARSGSPAPAPSPASGCLRAPGLARAVAGEEGSGSGGGGGEEEEEEGDGPRRRQEGAPAEEKMEEEEPPAAAARPEEPEDMDFLSGLELADLLDPRQPDWDLEPGLSSPGPLSSGGGSDSGCLWRGDDDDEMAAAEMQRFSDLLQRLVSGGGSGSGSGSGAGSGPGSSGGSSGGGGGSAGACGGGGSGGGGERRRRRNPGAGGGDGGGGAGGHGPAAAKSPRKAAAAAARLNRLKKKEYVMGLESRVRGLAAENQELRAENRELGKRVQALQEESRYLRAVLANETGLARLLSRLSGGGLRLTTSLFRDSPAGDHDYALPLGERQQEAAEDEDPAGGVCLHVDKDKVSVEFCSACARKASSSLKIFFFR